MPQWTDFYTGLLRACYRDAALLYVFENALEKLMNIA